MGRASDLAGNTAATPACYGLIGGAVGRYKAGSASRGMSAAVLPAVVVGLLLWVLFAIFDAPVIGFFGGIAISLWALVFKHRSADRRSHRRCGCIGAAGMIASRRWLAVTVRRRIAAIMSRIDESRPGGVSRWITTSCLWCSWACSDHPMKEIVDRRPNGIIDLEQGCRIARARKMLREALPTQTAARQGIRR